MDKHQSPLPADPVTEIAERSPAFETPRLFLRRFTLDDADEIHRLVYADPAVADWWTGLSRAVGDVRDRMANTAKWKIIDGFGFHAIVRKGDARLLGLIGFQRHTADEDNSFMVIPGEPGHHVGHDPDRIEAELTYAIGQEYWRQGYAAEAAQPLLADGFGRMGIARLVNSVRMSNVGSVKLMQRLGFNVSPDPAGTEYVIGILERATYLSRRRE